MNASSSGSTADDAITPAELARAIDAGDRMSVLDVRDRDEIASWAIEGSSIEREHVPHARFLQAEVTGEIDDLAADLDLDEPITVVCGRGEASDHVADLLTGVGVTARNLAEGMTGWARVYRASEIDSGGSTTIVQYRRPSSGCLAYLVHAGGEAAVIDPLREFTDRYVADAADRGVDLRYAIDTHLHADHVSGVRRLAAETGAEPVLSEPAAARGVDDVTTIADGEALELGDTVMEAIAAPGHTSGAFAFRVGNTLLTGDSLFLDGVPRPDLEAGADGARDLARTLHGTLTERFDVLDDDLFVAPGHYGPSERSETDGAYATRLGDLRDRLSVFSLDRERFVERVLDGMGPRPANHERIVAINRGRESADDETAFELELGPNNCAAAPTE
ncbi:MBL fold metallo-hydrolase [Halococcus salifodinae]|uniref:Beta-lactamase domain-containing protein n=1 Tax=Halococcus salifodinae DSM 8989 TaxID=1227456 RepID=M0MYG1_9EURY|nr:MBL fold metallo-hydrolase [Halococcus salifodinae]EMA49889.1 beta-lactamase domain-containing protein [Halococcus salifodinae DSM 8989]